MSMIYCLRQKEIRKPLFRKWIHVLHPGIQRFVAGETKQTNPKKILYENRSYTKIAIYWSRNVIVLLHKIKDICIYVCIYAWKMPAVWSKDKMEQWTRNNSPKNSKLLLLFWSLSKRNNRCENNEPYLSVQLAKKKKYDMYMPRLSIVLLKRFESLVKKIKLDLQN